MRTPRLGKEARDALLRQFASDTEAFKAAENIGVSRNTAYFYYTHFREAIFKHLSRAPRFSGEVEIDETTFGGYIPKHVSNYGDPEYYTTQGYKDRKRKKYKRPPKILVVGIRRRGGDVYTHIAVDRRAETLLPIVHLVVESGSTVYTDKWSGYNKLGLSGYNHVVINHSKKFASGRGEHIANIESFWREIKPKIGRYRGGFRHNFPLHLKEQEFRWNHRHEKSLLPLLTQILSLEGTY